MYKLMYKINTEHDNMYAFWGQKSPEGEIIPYAYEREDEVKEAGKNLAKEIGTDDIRVVLDEDYYLQLIYGSEPIPEEITFSVTINSEASVIIPEPVNNIKYGSDIEIEVKGLSELTQYHLLIDGDIYPAGLPKWIDCIKDKIIVKNITKDHIITIVAD